jgi:hypothetical protein
MAILETWRRIVAALGRPGDQDGDWYAWGTVQVAHAGIGVALAGLGILAGLAPWLAAALAAALYGWGKEVRDLLQEPTWRIARDSLRDWLFVAGGCAVAAALSTGSGAAFAVALGLILIGLAIGVYQRAASA